MVVWNNRFPLDRWWRRKYNIPYLSGKHRESSFFWQYHEYYEEVIFKEYYDEKEKEREREKEGDSVKKYIPLSGNWWKGLGSTKKEVNDWFNAPI